MVSRDEAVEIARSWVGTPYVRTGRIKKVGCDCGTLLADYLVEIGACPASEMDRVISDLGFLSNDWFCHAAAEKYFQVLHKVAPLKWTGVCRGILIAQPGDLAMYRVVGSPIFNHGSILLGNGRGIHAVMPKVAEMRPTLHPMTAFTEMAIFDPWAEAD